jgi:hypothetical protein
LNLLSALIKCTTIGFLVGFLVSAGHDLDKDILPLAWMLVFISTILVLRELTYLEPPTMPLQQRAVISSVGPIGVNEG